MNRTKVLIAIFSALAISSCAMPDIKATKNTVSKDKSKTKLLYKKTNNFGKSYITHSDAPFLASKSFLDLNSSQELPKIFYHNIDFNTIVGQSLEEYVIKLHSMTGLNIEITADGLDYAKTQVISFKPQTKNSSTSNNHVMSYSGSLKDFFNQLTNTFKLSWRYDNQSQKVIIFYKETKTFKLAIPESEINNSTSIGNSDANNKSLVSYKTTKSNEFQEAITTIKTFSKDIQISSDDAYAMITVTATHQVMEKVDKYIARFNEEAKKGVQVKISVYEVKTTKSSNYGIDWNLVYNGTNTLVNWNTKGLENALSSSITTATIKAGIASGMWAGSNIVASALQKYLDATYLQGFNFYSLNGQTIPINNGQSDAYVKNLAVTTLGAGAVITADNIQTAVEQSTINTGFTGSVLTNVISNKIFLRMSLNFSKLVRLEQVSYGNTEFPSIIQLPHVESNKIIQNIMLKSGQTAVITGFTSDTNKVGTASLADKKWWWFGGNQGTDASRETMVVIVSAYNIGDTNV